MSFYHFKIKEQNKIYVVFLSLDRAQLHFMQVALCIEFYCHYIDYIFHQISGGALVT